MNRRGIAQLVVLWALLLLGTLATSFAFSMRTEGLASRNGLESERAYYQARAGVSRAIALLSESPPADVFSGAVTGGQDEATYEVRITPENGKLDINVIGEEALKEVLRNGGLSGNEAERLGDAILDWRDGDDETRPGGAEEREYAFSAEPVKPRNGRLAGVGELRYVKGVTDEIYTRLLSAVFTADGGMQGVNVNTAPVEVLRILPGVTPERAALAVASREENPFQSEGDVAALLGTESVESSSIPVFFIGRTSPVYTITSVGRAGGTVSRTIRCTIAVRGDPNAFKILRWEDHVHRYGEAG